MGKTLNRYLLREMLGPFLLGLAAFTAVLLIARILKLVELVVNRGVPPSTLLQILAYLLPAFLEVTLPMAFLLAILVTFSRLTTDRETLAIQTCGISLYQMSKPAVLFALFAALLTFFFTLYARPRGNNALKETLYEITKRRATAGLQEKVFNTYFEGIVLYVEEISPPGTLLQGIMIADRRDPQQHNVIFARTGFILLDERKHALTLRLRDGTVHSTLLGRKNQPHTNFTVFTVYDVTLSLMSILENKKDKDRDPQDMTFSELSQTIAYKRTAGLNAQKELVELHRKFSIPFACFVFVLIGIPLGVQPTEAARARGWTLSLVVILCYYVFLTAGEVLGKKGILPPPLALWLPNMVLGGLGVGLFLWTAKRVPPLTRPPLKGWAERLRLRVSGHPLS